MRESWPQISNDLAAVESEKSYRRKMCDCILAQDPFNICAIYRHILGGLNAPLSLHTVHTYCETQWEKVILSQMTTNFHKIYFHNKYFLTTFSHTETNSEKIS